MLGKYLDKKLSSIYVLYSGIMQKHLEYELLEELREFKKEIMAAIDDLNTAVQRLQTSTSDEIKSAVAAILAAQQSNGGAVSAVDAEAIVAKLNSVSDTLDAETKNLNQVPPVV